MKEEMKGYHTSKGYLGRRPDGAYKLYATEIDYKKDYVKLSKKNRK